MLAAVLEKDSFLYKEVMNSPLWVAEEKYDGERLMFQYKNKKVSPLSRRGNQKKLWWLESVQLPFDIILDGEVYREGATSTDVVHLLATQEQDLNYAIFDILEIGEIDLKILPYAFRRLILATVWHEFFRENSRIVLSTRRKDKEQFYQEVVSKGGEGVVLKDIRSSYEESRSSSWLKLKKEETFDVVITSAKLKLGTKAAEEGKLMLFYGYWDKFRKNYKEAGSLGVAVDPSEANSFLFKVAEVKGYFRYPTGAIRHPHLIRFREDKSPQECVLTDV